MEINNLLASYSVIYVALVILLVGLNTYLIIKLLKSQKSQAEAESKYRGLESNVQSLELEALESKLDPHLFKNILNSIQSHAYQTYFAIDKLSNVLDYILYESKKKFVSPKDEIDFAMNLIEINKVKLSPLFNLNVKTIINDSEPLYGQSLLAPMISIALIENAFKHADLQSPEAFISILFEFKDSTFSLTVSNRISSGVPLKKEKAGLGNQTLERRLKIIYKSNCQLHHFVEGDVYIAQLKINLLEQKTQMFAT